MIFECTLFNFFSDKWEVIGKSKQRLIINEDSDIDRCDLRITLSKQELREALSVSAAKQIGYLWERLFIEKSKEATK